jgi:hypothetical protein
MVAINSGGGIIRVGWLVSVGVERSRLRGWQAAVPQMTAEAKAILRLVSNDFFIVVLENNERIEREAAGQQSSPFGELCSLEIIGDARGRRTLPKPKYRCQIMA